MRMWLSKEHIRTNMFGFYNYALGSFLSKKFTSSKEYLQDHFNDEHGLDLEVLLKASNTILIWDDKITAPAFGFGNIDNYYFKASCYHQLPNI